MIRNLLPEPCAAAGYLSGVDPPVDGAGCAS